MYKLFYRKLSLSVLIICLILPFSSLRAQHNESLDHSKNRDLNNLAYNVGFGVLTSTVGGIINKPKNQSVWDTIKKTCWQGAAGGALQFSGKLLLREVGSKHDFMWAWSSKLVHSAGVSMCHNGAMAKPFGEYWVFDYACLHLIVLNRNGRVEVQPQFNLLFLYDLTSGLGSDVRVDWTKTLELGVFTMKQERIDINEYGQHINGYAYTRSIGYSEQGTDIKTTLKHEILHTYQGNEYRVMNTYFNPLLNKIKNNPVNNIFKYVYVEFPFFATFYGITYKGNRYPANFYEQEANYFSETY